MGPVTYSGEFPSYFRSEFEQTVSSSLERANGVPIHVQGKACTQLDCVRRAALEAGLAVIVMSRLLRDNRDYHIEFVAHAVDDGRVLAETTADCIICGQQELLDAIPAKLTELNVKVAQALAAQTWPPRVSIAGWPGNASLTLDGDELGSPPVDMDLEPGDHQLEIKADGYATQLHRWTAVDGVEQRIEYKLIHLAPDRGLKIAGWTAGSVGVVGTGVGVTLAALNGRNHGPTCASDQLDPSGECPNVYATAVAGYVTLGLGVAALATGVGLLVLRYQRQRPRGPSSVRVGVGPGGVSLRF